MTINISEETKEKFKRLKLDVASQKKESISEDDLLVILIDKFQKEKR